MRNYALRALALALVSLVLPAQARPSIQRTSSASGANCYTNCVPYVPTQTFHPKVTVARAVMPFSGRQEILSYGNSAHQKLEERWVNYSHWDGGAGQWTPANVQLSSVIEEQAKQVGIDPLIIEIIVKHESAFNPTATSVVGAQGLMQLMPATATDLGVKNAYDPVQNISAGTRYFADLYRQFGDLSLALAAYNAGPGCVSSCGGVPPFAETQDYVASIAGEYVSRRRKRAS